MSLGFFRWSVRGAMRGETAGFAPGFSISVAAYDVFSLIGGAALP
jgi:hypothetical protein